MMILSLKKLLEKLYQIPNPKQTIILGIDGGGAAGKSTLARKLKELDPNVDLVQMDDFYRPSSERKLIDPLNIGGNWDWQRVESQVLKPLTHNVKGKYQRYDWDQDKMAEWHTVPTGGFVIIEGCFSIRMELAHYYDFKIWVEGKRSSRLERGVQRDGEAFRSLWEDIWLPAEDRYFDVQQPTIWADLILDGSGEFCSLDDNEIKIISNTRSDF
jgi:uridine kinase